MLKKEQSVEYRTINIKKEDYAIIKEYCNNNALKISEWVVINIKKVIEHEQSKAK